MNPTDDTARDDRIAGSGDELPEALRFRLRAMRTDETPEHDLWPGIAARLDTRRATPRATPRRWLPPLALAATLVIAVGATGLWRGALPPGAMSDRSAPTLVQREAAGMARQYDAALGEIAASQVPGMMQPTLDELDRHTSQIHAALKRDPDSRLLLEQLRRTYSHRLALTQRADYS